MVIPLLGLEPLGQAPPGIVVSEAEAIQLIWGHVNSDFRGFRGIAGVSCKLSGRKSVCLESGGCRERGVPCLMFKVKEQWVEAGIPTFNEDRQIISKLSNLKSLFDKKRNNKKLSNQNKQIFLDKLQHTTLNLAPVDWEDRIKREKFLSAAVNAERIRVVKDYIGKDSTRSAEILPESPARKEGRLAWHQGSSRQGDTAVQSSSAELGGSQSIEPHTRGSEGSQSEGFTGVESQESGEEQADREREKKRRQYAKREQKKRRREEDDDSGKDEHDDEDNYVQGRIPRDLLAKLSLLSVNLKMSVRQQLTVTMAVYELCSINPSDMNISLSSALRSRHRATHAIAQERVAEVAQKVKDSDSKIFLHYDTKINEQNLDGVRENVDRLAVVISSPCLERDVLLCAFPLESGTGEAQADAVFTILVATGLQDHVGGIGADTTASNFGQYRGSIIILQVHHTRSSFQQYYIPLFTKFPFLFSCCFSQSSYSP